MLKRTILLTFLALLPAITLGALPEELRGSIDKAAHDFLVKTGAPSVSIAIVRDGKLVYVRAYGLANVATKTPATPEMRYGIGSVSKQFTAAAALLLAEEGRLSLDDRVVRWLPELSRAADVTVRQLLSMTSGYQDYWPQDYVIPRMMHPVTGQEIMQEWARKPLDFEPGTKYQYSNTNYVIAGLIIERVAGMSLMEFLQRRIFGPLQMSTVTDFDAEPLSASDAAPYMRVALGPIRPAPRLGKGWSFGAGQLAMTSSDLAKWNISLIDQTLLKPSSYRELQKEVQLDSGVGVRYGLGVGVSMSDGRRVISHGGGASGFTTQNDVYPDERAAVIVFTNMYPPSTAAQLASRIGTLLFGQSRDDGVELAKRIFADLQVGKIDRTLLTSNANSYFSDEVLRDFQSSLGPLGRPTEFTRTRQNLRGGMTVRLVRVSFRKRILRVSMFTTADGKVEQYIVAPAE